MEGFFQQCKAISISSIKTTLSIPCFLSAGQIHTRQVGCTHGTLKMVNRGICNANLSKTTVILLSKSTHSIIIKLSHTIFNMQNDKNNPPSPL